MKPNLFEILRQVHHSGPNGFEGLIAALLEALTDSHFNLAISGSQEGRDMSSRRPNANVIAVECKRYRQNSVLDKRELLGELEDVHQAIPDLDLWVLVTSREVPSLLEESLTNSAAEKGMGFFAISSADGDPSSLEVLCANSPEIIAAHPGVQSVASAKDVKSILQQIAEHPKYTVRLMALKDKFSSPLVGYENWRGAQNQWFLGSLKSDQEARASHGQPINVEEPGVMLIKREAAWASLDEWQRGWKDKKVFFAALGEEGDGKTWSVASWLSEKIKRSPGFPAVIFLSSPAVTLGETGSVDLQPLFSDAILPRLSHSSKEQVQRRLNRWLSRPKDESPLFLLVLDGINERRSADWWRRVFEQLTGKQWQTQVAVLITCRTSYWERYFKPLRNLPTSSFIIQPFNDDELSNALAHHNLRREVIQDSVLPIIRKPRYLNLMVKHHERIAESGDVTVARLIYEDWRDRYGRRSLPLSDYDFQNIIRQLAQKHRTTNSQLSRQDVADVLTLCADQRVILDELQTGGVLQDIKGQYKVNERLLVYGLGLLLADQLEQTGDGQDYREIIAGWLEPQAEMDIKAAICEFATLHAMTIGILHRDAIVALLVSWVNSHNPAPNIESNLMAYLPIDPRAYVDLAEIVWADTYDNRWAQELITRSFLQHFDSPDISPILRLAFERWLGFVHIQGFPLHRNEDANKAKQKIAEQLGRNLELGPFEFAGYPMTAIDDDGQLRLGRMALAVISHFPRKQFIRAITIGFVAEAIMDQPNKDDLFGWILRTSPHDIWPDLREEVEKLLAVSNTLTQRAARWLLACEGSAEALNLRETIPDEIFPPNPWLESHRQDPCTSGFAWSEEDCISCLQREDLPVWHVARHIEPYCADPNLPMPDFLKAKVGTLAETIDTKETNVALGQTSADHNLKVAEPMLAAYAPESLASFIRSIARQIIERQDMARRQLSITLIKHSLILKKDEQEAVRFAWDELLSKADSWSEPEEAAEMFLFKLILTQMDGDSQLAALVRRPDKARDLIAYEDSFLPISNWDFVRAQLAMDSDNRVTSRILWFLSTSYSSPSQEVLSTVIVPLLKHDDRFVRALALKLVYDNKEPDSIKSVIDSGWNWCQSNHELENRCGSLLLSNYGEHLAFDEILRRVHPNFRGYAVERRGNKQAEVQGYAELIHQLWLRLSTNNPGLPWNLPKFTVESTAPGEFERISRPKLADDLSSFSITFIDQHSTWGGTQGMDDPDFPDWNTKTVEESRRKLWEIIQETIEQQRVAGNFWFGHEFYEAALDRVVEERPDLIAQWVSCAQPDKAEGLRYIGHGGSFYTALCRVLLKGQVKEGIQLYWWLQEAHTRIREVTQYTQIDLLDFALFAAIPCEDSEAAWLRKLEQCNTDQELMNIVMLAQGGSAIEWLWSYINEKLHSTAAIDKARAIVLLGYVDDQQALELIEYVLQNQPDSWLGKLAKTAKQHWKRNSWAKHWFNRFLAADDDTTAWASFRLLLRCADSGFWFWREQAEMDAKPDSKRKIFLQNNLENVRNAIRDNGKAAAEQFLGQKILKRQVWPWM